MSRSGFNFFLVSALGICVLSACSTAKKERLDQRETLSKSSGIYCDFVNGEKFNDVEVMMNLEMAKRCDSAKPFSISGYKSPAEVSGMMYCCSLLKKGESGSGAMAKSTSPSLAPSSGNSAKSGTSGSASPGSGSVPGAAGGAAGKSSGGTPAPPAKDPLLDEVVAE